MKAQQRKRIRRGAIVAATLACLVIVGLLTAVMLRQFAVQHRRAAQRQRQMQAFWLCESAVSRAVAQVAASPDYQGETWKIPAGRFGGEFDAVAVIAASVAPSDPNQRAITIETYYPAAGEDRILYRRQLEVTRPPTGDNP